MAVTALCQKMWLFALNVVVDCMRKAQSMKRKQASRPLVEFILPASERAKIIDFCKVIGSQSTVLLIDGLVQ